jgi:hypothetical protein
MLVQQAPLIINVASMLHMGVYQAFLLDIYVGMKAEGQKVSCRPLRFSGRPDTTAGYYVETSQCCLLHSIATRQSEVASSARWLKVGLKYSRLRSSARIINFIPAPHSVHNLIPVDSQRSVSCQ